MNFFKSFFKKSKGNIEVKEISNSSVFILQSATKNHIVDISSIIRNNPYNDIIIENPHSYNGSLAILSKNISKRDKTINSIKREWDGKTWLNIHGGYDTGKSHLSLLLNENLKYKSSSFSFKDLSQFEFKNIIALVFKQILANVLESQYPQLIIFDDLPQLGFDDNVNNLFVELLNYCKENNIKILSTSNYKINYKIFNIIKDNFIELPVPLLTKMEIKDIISTYSREKNSLKYATIIEAVSQGYPIFVQIICQYLDSKNWIIPEGELINFISGKAFNKLNNDTYQKLLHTTQNESAREILYRLNLILGTISNETIEIVSNANPPVTSPYEKINSLSGTWLQKNSDDTYFISPLIKNLGSNNVLIGTRKEINNNLAKNILSKKSFSQYAAQRAINYFIAGESYDDAGMIMVMALQSYFKSPEIFTDSILGNFWVNTALPVQMNSLTQVSIRILQLNIYDDLQVKNHIKFSIDSKLFIRNDLEEILLNKILLPEEIINITNLILFKSYLHDDVNKSLLYLDILINIGFQKFEITEKNLYNNLWAVLDRVHTIEEILKWFKCFNKIGKNEDFYDNEMVHLFSRRLCDNILERKDDWDTKVKILNIIEDNALANKLELLGAYSLKNNILIIAEKTNDLNGAEIKFSKSLIQYTKPEAIFLINDEWGRQQFYKGNKEEALLTLLAVENIKISVTTKLDTYLTIAKIFGEKDTIIAHEYTKKALDYADKKIKISRLSLSKLTGEYAISFWFLNDSKSAIYKLAESYEILIESYKKLDTFDNIDDYNITVIRIGTILNYIFQILKFGKPPEKLPDGSDYALPERGLFNNNYDTKLLNEWYYDERKFMTIFILIQSFEFFNDIENASKWSNYAFELDKEIFLYNFKNSLRSFIGYKILQNKYEEAIEVELDLKEHLETINIEMANEIINVQQKAMFLDLLNRMPSSKDSDDYYITYNLIPILLRELTLLLELKNTEVQLIANLKEHLFKSDIFYSDKKSKEFIYYILDNYPNDQNKSRKLIAWVNEIENENKKPIQIICYLICSINAPTREALKLHLALMPYLEKVLKGLSTGIYLFILYPFVRKFWSSRIYTSPQDFYFLELWQKNLNMSLNIKNEFKVVAILALICMHRGYKPDKNEQDWMQNYIDYTIKNR